MAQIEAMKRFFSMMVLMCMHALLYVASTEVAIYGTWQVTGVADSQDTTSMSSEDADSLVGRDLHIATNQIQFDDDICRKPSFHVSRQHTRQLFRRDFRFDPMTIALPDPVTEIKISCENPASGESCQ
jgi:hypothetical protein